MLLTILTQAAAAHVDAAASTPGEGVTGGATVLGLNAEGWVYVSLTIFLLAMLIFARAHHRVRDALDAKIAETARQLDEAKAVRAEAETLLAEAKARQAASAGDAESILHHAEQEAQIMLAKAERDTADLIARRGKMAEDKIAAAERGALAEVRAKAADAAAGAARAIIADRHGAEADRAMIDRSIAGLARVN